MVKTAYPSIAQLNITLTRWVMGLLGITTPTLPASGFAAAGTKTERLIDLLRQCGASCYLSGPSAAAYLDLDLFQKNGIGLEYKTYDYAPYPQLYPPFAGNVSILDVLFHMGPDAGRHITSATSPVVVLPLRREKG